MAIYKLFQDDANRTNVIYLTAIMTKLASIKDTLYELYKFKLCWNKKILKNNFHIFWQKQLLDVGVYEIPYLYFQATFWLAGSIAVVFWLAERAI